VSFGGDGGHDEVMCEINVTPLCDIFVVLLIIFMLTGEQVTAKGPDVNMPELPIEVKNDAQVSVTMTKDKQLYVFNEPVTQDTLVAVLKAKLANPNLPNTHVIFRGDRGLLMRDVVAVMMKCNEAGSDQVSIQSPFNKEAK
jgi:biopolymer transport protein ExbD